MIASLRPLLAALALGALSSGACTLTFPCSSDEQCSRDGAAGVCQASGYCSFPDADCESDQRYGELAPAELAGTCVPVGGESTTGEDVGTVAATMAEGTTSSGGADGPSTLDGTAGSTDTGEPACCHAGCEGTCGAACGDEPIGGPATDQEAIGVAAVGDEWVVWSTGYGRSLRLASMTGGGGDEVLAVIDDNAFVTKIAADDTHVYFVDYGGPTVKRAAVPGGAIDLVTEVEGGMADFGGITVGRDHVYFAMRGSGGVWRAAKDLSDQAGAQLVSAAETPFDVALDDTHVYWIDDGVGRIERLAVDEIGSGAAASSVYDGQGLTTLAVDATHVYFGSGGTIGRALKDGDNQGIETLASDQGSSWDIGVDATHVYWTSDSNGHVVRVPIEGGAEEVLASTAIPWGLDLGCTTVFWAENGTQTLHMVLK
ncbi:MAG: hypothetical protein KDK70_12490 [Myxococcales bacterium]|nr:hypothetical protein [Myxococcales bacterium]